jgi:hypothetical protein
MGVNKLVASDTIGIGLFIARIMAGGTENNVVSGIPTVEIL